MQSNLKLIQSVYKSNKSFNKSVLWKNHNFVRLPQHVIALRGTKDFNDHINNFNMNKQIYKNVYMHSGYLNQALEIKTILSEHLNKQLGYDLTGHSSGGCVATILAYMMTIDGYTVNNVSTFGSPKFTNENGSAILESTIGNINNIVCNQDPFWQWPPHDHVAGKYYTFNIDSNDALYAHSLENYIIHSDVAFETK